MHYSGGRREITLNRTPLLNKSIREKGSHVLDLVVTYKNIEVTKIKNHLEYNLSFNIKSTSSTRSKSKIVYIVKSL